MNSVFTGASNQLGEFESGATAALLGPVGTRHQPRLRVTIDTQRVNLQAAESNQPPGCI